ncbi:MAG: hypothetical protein HXY38_03785 [Chloroflexi bacterium]|nr:hypothetical protein [Chloroflexota bacterium]
MNDGQFLQEAHARGEVLNGFGRAVDLDLFDETQGLLGITALDGTLADGIGFQRIE